MRAPRDGGVAERVGVARRAALGLALCVIVSVLLLGAVRALTAERVAAARAARLAERLAAVLPERPFDAPPGAAPLAIEAAALGGEGPRPLYRARRDGEVIAVAFPVTAPDGYVGPIELLVGVRADGEIVAVRVIEHRETPGLGDRIERRRSDWIETFDGISFAATAAEDWYLRRAGGRFDALSGATITSRAVARAVHRALAWFEANRATLLDASGDGRDRAEGTAR